MDNSYNLVASVRNLETLARRFIRKLLRAAIERTGKA
jgi:hypothetical protein